ncbi:FUSC family protein [Streptomyces sp. NPDC048606]|uniref:FUSC family protein n=1 Tax=Streptomyces sp. NPDC048606 TaxID=3154726 RepID=UPI00341A5A66
MAATGTGRRAVGRPGRPGQAKGAPRRPRLPAAYAHAARISLRVTLAAGAGFYLFLYGFGQTVAATYALFAAVSLAGLSRIPGTGRQRAEVLVRLIPAVWLLIAAGTFLAVRTWSAVLGMLVIGFALAFVAVGGPRPAGAAPGLQLMYILPSFPPYAPDTLGERLVGATVGLVLLIAAEAWLLPDPPTVPYRELAARAALTAERCARELTRPPYGLSPATREAAGAAAETLRPSRVPEAERPAGPGVRSRALAHTGLATRTLINRLLRLPALPPGEDPADDGLDILRAVGRSTSDTAARLRGAGADPSRDAARAGADADDAATARTRALLACATARDVPPQALRRRAALIELADAALALSSASRLAVRGRAAASEVAPHRFSYASERAPSLWWRRLIGHAGSRSVFFQNAVRISLALAAARAVAGMATLPHGFWALLATLTLTRTTVVATRTTVRQAVTGTLIGALITAGVLALVGTDTTVYAVVMVPLLLLTFTVGPVKGVGWAQALFAIVVALVFAQLAPATWRLAEVRLLDVLIGSAIGAVFGLLAWPRGAQDEVRRSCAAMLRAAAETVVATTAAVASGTARTTAREGPVGYGTLHHWLVLAESAFAQLQSEPPGQESPARDWQTVLLTGHHTLWGVERALAPPVTSKRGPDPRAAVAVTRLGDRVAGRMLLQSATLDPLGGAPPPALRPAGVEAWEATHHDGPDDATGGFYAADAWLRSLLLDLERLAQGPPEAARATPGADTTSAPRPSP